MASCGNIEFKLFQQNKTEGPFTKIIKAVNGILIGLFERCFASGRSRQQMEGFTVVLTVDTQ